MSSDDELFEVRLLDLPLVLRERSREQGADLLREMELVRGGQQSGAGTHDVPRRLLELVDELERVYAPYIASTTQDMDAALDRGEETLPEVVYRLPRASAGFVRHLAEVLREVEDYCRAGEHLLTLAPPPDIAAYREWSIGEVERQHAGQPPVSWPQFVRERGV